MKKKKKKKSIILTLSHKFVDLLENKINNKLEKLLILYLLTFQEYHILRHIETNNLM